MVAQESLLILNRHPGAGRALAACVLWGLAVALPVAGAQENEALRYRAVTTALDWGDPAAARELATSLTDESLFARKADLLVRLAGFLASEAEPRPVALADSANLGQGALRATLCPDGAFSAALFPEEGEGPFVPLLFGWPQAWTNRLSLSVDGKATMLAPHGRPRARGDRLTLGTREHDIEVRLSMRLRAPSASSHRLLQESTLSIEASVTNRAAGTREVGLRMLLDLARGFDDAPAVRIGRRHRLATAGAFSGDQVPRFLSVGPLVIALRGPGTIPVDRVVLAPTPAALAAPFDFPLTPATPLGPDSCLALYLEPEPMARGTTRTLRVEISGSAPGREEIPPIVSSSWVEPVAGNPQVRRVLLALENAARGIAGPLDSIRVTPHLSAGLEAVAASPAKAASAQAQPGRSIASLPPGETTQFALLVRPTYRAGASPEVRFDIDMRSGSQSLHRSTRISVPPSPNLSIAGVARDLRGRPVPGAEIILYRDGRPVGRGASDGAGRYRFTRVAPVPHRILARRVVHREPAAKRGRADVDDLLYDIVLTSQRIDNRGRAVLPEVLPGERRDVVLGYSLTRYSLFVSVEYDAPRAYLEQIVRGMRRAAEFLYTASDGQLTYGRVVVADAAEHWLDADLYDWANAAVHPNASVAGIRHRFDPVRAPWNTAMNFGRGWARTWDTHGLYCTVVHEFGHYGLGLFDEYLGAPEGRNRGLSYPEMCRCIMGYQFADHKICWQGNHHAYTNQGLWNRRSCWEQIEAWHEGVRSGFFVPITTPIERGGVVPPDFRSTIGRELVARIHDHDTGAFDADLRLSGPFSSGPGGVLIYVDPAGGGRVLYHGTTHGDGRLRLVGLHVDDRVRGILDGRRAQFTIRARRPEYSLSFDSEPAAHAGPPPLVEVRPELSGSNLAGVNVEILPRRPLDGAPSLLLRAERGRDIALQEADVPGRPRFHAFIPRDEISGGRLLLEWVLPNIDAGDMTVVSDTVLGEIEAGEQGEIASFDGSLRVRIPADGLTEDWPVALSSTAAPPWRADDAISAGRIHTLLGPGEENPLRAPALLIFRLDPDQQHQHLEPRRLDPGTGTFAPLPTLDSPRPGEIIARMNAPGTFALFARNH